MSQEPHALRRQESLDKKKETAAKLNHTENLEKHKKEQAKSEKHALEHYNTVEKKREHAKDNREQKLSEIKENALASDHALGNAERKNLVRQQSEMKKLEEEMIVPTKENPPMKNVL